MKTQQQGSTVIGFVVGVVVGLAIALVVAVVITRMPVPFLHESPSRTADQDANESRKNKDWDPNAPLYGKSPAKSASAAGIAGPVPSAPASAAVGTTPGATAAAPIRPASGTTAKSADPLGDLVKQKTGGDPFVYFVQIGAFNSPTDAEAQRAKLALFSLDAKISERDQSGRTVYRVRAGPFDSKEEADKIKERADAAAFESSVLRVPR